MVIDRRHVESIASLVNQGKAILFIGEGVSAETQLKHPVTIGQEKITKFVRQDELARLMCKELSLPAMPLAEAAERFERRRGRVALNELLWRLYRDLKPGQVHRLLVKMGFKLMYTTNYDSLLETAFQQELGFNPVVAVRNTDAALVRERRTVIKLHGDIAQPDSILITERDYADYPQGREALFDILQADLYVHSFVFLGYGLRDNSLRTLYRSMVSILGRFVNLSYAVLPSEEIDPEVESIWRDNYQIQFLSCDIGQFLEALDTAVKWDHHRNQLEEMQRRVDCARQHFRTQADNYDHAVLTYLGSPQDLEALMAKVKKEHVTNQGLFAHVDFKTAGPLKGRAGLFKYILETLIRGLKESAQHSFGDIMDYELDFAEYERKAQSEEYRYLLLHYGERADRMMQGEEPIPDRSQVQEIGEETFVQEAMDDFLVFLKCLTEKVGWRRIALVLDRLDLVEQFLPTLQVELLERVINANKNVLFVISYAGSQPPQWDTYAFEDRHVQYHELSASSPGTPPTA